jgi:3-oxoacyl-[acyl-carrier protein] reductase
MSLAGRIALVSGGSRGIGRAIALGLAADGADVAVNYRHDEDAARATVAAIEKLGRRAQAYAADVGDWEQCAAMVESALGDFGRFDILVCNAGVASRGLTVADTDPREPDRLWKTHVYSAWALAKLVVPTMRAAPRGDVVMISSVATQYMAPNSAPYNMAKAALEALAVTLAKRSAITAST